MNSTMDPLDAKDMLKSATIYRNSEFNYIYVCYHCECSFTDIVATLNHVEGHFDAKLNIASDLSEPQCFETDKKPETILLIENVFSMLSSEIGSASGGIKTECVEKNYDEENEDDVKTDSKRVINKDHLRECKLCDQTFVAEPLLIIHILKDHANEETTFTCPQCSQNCIDEETLLTHLQLHIDINDTTYDTLVDRLKSKCEEAVKIKIEKGPPRPPRYIKKKEPKVCDICLSTFSTKETLISHMKQKHIPKPEVKKFFFDCEKCKRKIDGRFAFYAHQYGHLMYDDRDNIADDETLQQNLRKHIDDNISCDESTPKKTFGCKLCGLLSLKQRYSAQYHILQQHIYLLKQKKQKIHSCEYCGRKFASSSNLVVHTRTHTLEKPFKCLICNKSFSHSSYMRYHEKIHTGLQPHQCSICGQTFRTNNKLNFHLKCHASTTMKCPICDKEIKEHRLKLHMRNVHENEHRPYQCTVCLLTFKTAKTMKTHSYRHSNVKRFECRHHCKLTFFSSASRRAHERAKHDAH